MVCCCVSSRPAVCRLVAGHCPRSGDSHVRRAAVALRGGTAPLGVEQSLPRSQALSLELEDTSPPGTLGQAPLRSALVLCHVSRLIRSLSHRRSGHAGCSELFRHCTEPQTDPSQLRTSTEATPGAPSPLQAASEGAVTSGCPRRQPWLRIRGVSAAGWWVDLQRGAQGLH